MNLGFQIMECSEWRENKNKCIPGVKEIDKTNDMNSKYVISM